MYDFVRAHLDFLINNRAHIELREGGHLVDRLKLSSMSIDFQGQEKPLVGEECVLLLLTRLFVDNFFDRPSGGPFAFCAKFVTPLRAKGLLRSSVNKNLIIYLTE